MAAEELVEPAGRGLIGKPERRPYLQLRVFMGRSNCYARANVHVHFRARSEGIVEQGGKGGGG